MILILGLGMANAQNVSAKRWMMVLKKVEKLSICDCLEGRAGVDYYNKGGKDGFGIQHLFLTDTSFFEAMTWWDGKHCYTTLNDMGLIIKILVPDKRKHWLTDKNGILDSEAVERGIAKFKWEDYLRTDIKVILPNGTVRIDKNGIW